MTVAELVREQPLLEVERSGVTFVANSPRHGVYLEFSRVRQSHDGLHGDLTVEMAGQGHLYYGRFNASSLQTRKSTADYLRSRCAADIDWRELLEQLCIRIVALDQEASPAVELGNLPRRPEQPMLLAPLMPARRPTILFGEGGGGKSLLAAACAVSVASGVPLVDSWHVGGPKPVLVLDWEADVEEWNDRIADLCEGHDIRPPRIIYRGCSGSLVDQVEEVSRNIAQHGAQLLVVDSVGMASPSTREGGDANEGALRLFGALRILGVTTLLVDHVTKQGADAERGAVRPYGSIFKVNLARSVWELRAAEPDSDGTRHVALYHRKTNAGPLQSALGISIEHGQGAIRLHAEAVAHGALERGMALHERIANLLEAEGPMASQVIAEEMGEKDNKIRSILSRGKAMGRFAQFPDGAWMALRRGQLA